MKWWPFRFEASGAPATSRELTMWHSDTRPLQLRAWTEDPALSAEDRRFFKNYLTLARTEKRRAQKLVRNMKGKGNGTEAS